MVGRLRCDQDDLASSYSFLASDNEEIEDRSATQVTINSSDSLSFEQHIIPLPYAKFNL